MSSLQPKSARARTASVAERTALSALGEWCANEHYQLRCATISRGALYPSDLGRASAEATAHGEAFAAAYRCLALGEWQPLDALGTARLPVELLGGAGFLERRADAVRTSGWILAPVLGELHFAGVPATYPAARAIGAPGYVGHDSLLLASALGTTRGRSVLDVGCGSGVQGLLATNAPERIVLTDPDAFGLRLAAWNVAFSGFDRPVEIRQGRLYEPVGAASFDVIVSLPPYVPTLPESAASAIVAGGPLGLSVLSPLLAEAHRHLRPRGRLVALAQLCCDANGPVLARHPIPGLSVALSCFDWRPLQPYLLELATRVAGPAGDVRVLLDAYTRSLRAEGVASVCSALIEARRSEDGFAPGWHVRGFAPVRPGERYERVLHASLEPVGAGRRRLLVGGLERGLLEGPTAALFDALGAGRSLLEVVHAAWGPRPDVAIEDLLDQAIARLGELETLGAVARREQPSAQD